MAQILRNLPEVNMAQILLVPENMAQILLNLPEVNMSQILLNCARGEYGSNTPQLG